MSTNCKPPAQQRIFLSGKNSVVGWCLFLLRHICLEKQATIWDKTVIDRTSDLRNWVDLLKEMVNNKKIRNLFAFANNHYALCRLSGTGEERSSSLRTSGVHLATFRRKNEDWEGDLLIPASGFLLDRPFFSIFFLSAFGDRRAA
jgi:hypothetical protein